MVLLRAVLAAALAGTAAAFARTCANWPGLRYHEATQKGAHNAYVLEWPYAEMLACPGACARNIELDLAQEPGGAWQWSLSHDGYEANAPHGTLRSALGELAAWVDQHPRDGPLTLSIDVKTVSGPLDEWARQFEGALLEQLAGKFWTPKNFFDAAPSAETLHDAVKKANWPTLDELRGKVLCVISGNEEELKVHYAAHVQQRKNRLCFADIPEEMDEDGHRVFINHKIKKGGLAGAPIIGGLIGQDTSKFKAATFLSQSQDLKLVTRGWEANEEAVWDQAKESGILIVTTDKVVGNEWAEFNGQPFSFESLTFQHDDGQRVAIAASPLVKRSVIVEVHEDPKGEKLWHNLGYVSPSKRSVVFLEEAVQHDTGQQPSVAMTNTNVVVEVHKSENNDGLWINVGAVERDFKIQWKGAERFGNGEQPCVALYDVVGVVLFEGDGDKLRYHHVTVVDATTLEISTDDAQDFGTVVGRAPDCVMTSRVAGVCVYELDNNQLGEAHFTVADGVVSVDKTAVFAEGKRPSITTYINAANEQVLAEVHEADGGKLETILGSPRADGLKGNTPVAFDTGKDPTLAVVDDVLVHAHKSQNHDTLWSSAYWVRNACELPPGTTVDPPTNDVPPSLSSTAVPTQPTPTTEDDGGAAGLRLSSAAAALAAAAAAVATAAVAA